MKFLIILFITIQKIIFSQLSPSHEQLTSKSIDNVIKITFSTKTINSNSEIINQDNNFRTIYIYENTDSIVQNSNNGKSIEVNRYSDKKQLIESFEIFDNQIQNLSNLKYDSLGNNYSENEKWVYRFDENNNLIESTLISNWRPKTITANYNQNNILKIKNVYMKGKLTNFYEYDSKGKVILSKNICINNSTDKEDTLVTTIEYDTISNSVRTVGYGYLGDLDFEKVETFDKFGNTIRLYEMKATSPYEDYDHNKLTFSETGKAYTETDTFYEYTFDDFGNWITKKNRDLENNYYILERQIEYKENTNR